MMSWCGVLACVDDTQRVYTKGIQVSFLSLDGNNQKNTGISL